MSAQTKSAIDDALRAHIADEVGTMVVAWALAVASVDPESHAEGGAHYLREQPEGQPLHATEGLSRFGSRMVGDSWQCGGDDT